jgi:hypothetical protein
MRAALEEHFEPELVPWLLQEMAENRKKAVVRSKLYSQEAVMHALRTEGVVQAHWGCSTVMQKLRRKPELLQLQGP